MAKRVAFCLVENDIGQVLLVQRGYGKEKFKWSLPRGNCDDQETYHQAARREVREETGIRVEIVSLIFEGRRHAIKTYFGKIRGGRLKVQRPECLDAKFFDYNHLPPLAFSADRRAVKEWQGMKSTYTRLASNPRTPPCPNCGSDHTRLRRYPHHNPYHCRSCNKVFSPTGPLPNPSSELPGLLHDKEVAISDIIIGHILSERERLGLPAPAPNSGLGAAARDTAVWFAREEDFEHKILEYLRRCCAEQPGNANSSLSLRLAYGRHVWPADAAPSAIAKDVIEKASLSEVVNFPALDYLGVGSCHAVLDRSGNPVEITGGQPDRFGYALVVAYATDGNSIIVDRINKRREQAGAPPLQISVHLRGMARKFITLSTADEAGDSLLNEAQICGYATDGWRVRLDYSGSYAKFARGGKTFVAEPEMADIMAAQLIKDWPTLLRPDWQDIGIATGVKNHPELGGLNFQAEFVIGWRIPFDAERPAHFPPAIDQEGNPSTAVDASTRRGGEDRSDALRGSGYREPESKPRRRREWWSFRS